MIAAVLTPPDVLSQLSLAIPLMILYEASIYSVRMVEKKAQAAGGGRRSRRPIRRSDRQSGSPGDRIDVGDPPGHAVAAMPVEVARA